MKWFRKKEREKFTGCPCCKETNVASFSADTLTNQYNASIEHFSSFQNLDICQCTQCLTYFYRIAEPNGINQEYHKIFDGQLDLLEPWSKSSIGIPDHILNASEQIGFSTNWKNEKMLPCSVTFKDGTRTDSAIIVISSGPPLGRSFTEYQTIRFIDEVENIAPSPFALSSEIRKAINTAPERRMGVFPTIVKNSENQHFVINGFDYFIDQDGAKGSELQLVKEGWDHQKKNYIYTAQTHPVTLVIAK